MCVREHLNQKYTDSHLAAQTFAFQLEEYAKKNKIPCKGIHVRNKKEIVLEGSSKADAQVTWKDGPEGWVDLFELITLTNVCAYADSEDTISFYDIR